MFPRVACEEGAPRIPEDCPNMSSSADPCPFLQKLSYMSSVLPIGHVPVQPDGTREELMELASRCPVVRQVHGPEGTHPLISKDSSGQGAGPQATHVPSLQFASISSSIFGHVPGYSGDNDAPSKVPERRDFELSHTPEVPVRQPKTAPIDVSNVVSTPNRETLRPPRVLTPGPGQPAAGGGANRHLQGGQQVPSS
eukprot:scaffold1317_cov348-Prasinococcus_capsulatus_cf.AAC.2